METKRISLQSYIKQGGDINEIDWSKSKCDYTGYDDYMCTVVSFEDKGDVNTHGEPLWYFTFENGNTRRYALNWILIDVDYVLKDRYDTLQSEKAELVEFIQWAIDNNVMSRMSANKAKQLLTKHKNQ